jgi:hypothetical protein
MRIKQQWVQHQVYSYYFNDDRLLLNSGKMAPTAKFSVQNPRHT